MEGTVAKRLGITVLLIPAALLGLFATPWASESFQAVLTVGLLAVVIGAYVWGAFRFWRVSIGTPAEGWFRAALLSGVALPAVQTGVANVLLWLGVDSATSVFGTGPTALVTMVPMLLFAAGLLRSRWVPCWIPWIGAASAAITATTKVMAWSGSTFEPAPMVWITLAASFTYLVALGVSLLIRSRAGGDEGSGFGGDFAAQSHAEPALPAGGGKL